MYSEIVPFSITPAELRRRNPKGIILSGGPKSVHVEGAPAIDPGVYELGIPILGICYGAQLIAQQLGGEVARTGRGEYGGTDLSVVETSNTLQVSNQRVWMSHFDSIVRAPAGFRVVASTPEAAVAVLENDQSKVYGVQYHPEVVHSPQGQALLERFLHNICEARPSWTMWSIIDTEIGRAHV